MGTAAGESVVYEGDDIQISQTNSTFKDRIRINQATEARARQRSMQSLTTVEQQDEQRLDELLMASRRKPAAPF